MQETSYDLYLVVRNGVTTMPATITTLSNKAKQPKGGYLPLKLFKEIHYNTKHEFFPDENVSKPLIKTTVDNMTRILLGAKAKKVFQPATSGLMVAKVDIFGDTFDLTHTAANLDDDSILAAFQLSIYETIYRSGYRSSVNLENKLPDNPTIENIREMINRSPAYFKQQEHIIDVGDRLFVKYKGDTIYGNYDYLTEDS